MTSAGMREKSLRDKVLEAASHRRDEFLDCGRRAVLDGLADGVIEMGAGGEHPEVMIAPMYHLWARTGDIYLTDARLCERLVSLPTAPVPPYLWDHAPSPAPLLLFPDSPDIALPTGGIGHLAGVFACGMRSRGRLTELGDDDERTMLSLFLLVSKPMHSQLSVHRVNVVTELSKTLAETIELAVTLMCPDGNTRSPEGHYARALLTPALATLLYACVEDDMVSVAAKAKKEHPQVMWRLGEHTASALAEAEAEAPDTDDHVRNLLRYWPWPEQAAPAAVLPEPRETSDKWRVWQHGDLVALGADAVERLLKDLVEHAGTTGGRVTVDEVDIRGDHGYLHAHWVEDDGVRTRALFALRTTTTLGELNWLTLSVTGRPWTPRDIAPMNRLGVLALVKSCRDAQGSPLSTASFDFSAMDTAPGAEELLNVVADGMVTASEYHTVLLASTATDPFPQAWPGLVNVFVISEERRVNLAPITPPLPSFPRGQLRLFASPKGPLRGRSYSVGDPALDDAIALRLSERNYQALPSPWCEDDVLVRWWDEAATGSAAPAEDVITVAEAERLRAELAEVRTQLQISQRHHANAVSDLDRLRAEQRPVSAEVSDVLAQLDQAQRDLAAAYADRDGLEAERDAALRHLSRVRGRYAAIIPREADVPDEAEPREFAGFAELLAVAAEELTSLTFTADPRAAAPLDDHTKAAVWRRRTWDVLTSLAHYADSARGAERPENFVAFLRGGHPGAAISPTLVAPTESVTTLADKRAYRARVFPVSPDTDPSGEALYQAHVRIERWQPPAPRLHYYDDLAATGTLYVGYLGPHLPIPTFT
ncbi:hypothetical protein NLX83_35490 [Allokutzneria sp. A3M-2-11 16]|uniref:hypothetical protein n=1 Tax=Allokutzneria sp. A3M-2-11 16 TaxID=2962043 RepID=UPI0020B6ABB2|nr:hypothetical protein [Allokutzneria sp. A3M-2-11 16]MCP3804588.1 hypothetical protein [Allokutzneria sp. A3M-2-11 16]